MTTPTESQLDAMRVKCAELCGWKELNLYGGHVFGFANEGPWNLTPNYPRDLNAMHEAEKMLTEPQREAWHFWLSHICELGTYIRRSLATLPRLHSRVRA